MQTPERQIVHHLTTEVGSIQLSQGENDVRLDVDNRATYVNMSVDRWLLHGVDMSNTMVFVHETDNILVSHVPMESTLERYRNVVSIIVEKDEGDVARRSTINLYIDPKVFKKAVAAMTIETLPPAEEPADEN